MIVLDTTVLVYPKGAEHRLRGSCRDLVAAIVEAILVDIGGALESLREGACRSSRSG